MPLTPDRDSIRLDADLATVVDRLAITQGAGEDAETWHLELLTTVGEGGGTAITWLLEDYNGKLTLYEEADARPDGTFVKESGTVRVKSEAGSLDGETVYEEGMAPGGDDVVELGDWVFVEDAGAVRYGPDEAWVARASTAAADLVTWNAAESEAATPGSSAGVLVDYGVAAGVAVLALLDGFVQPVGFGWVFWITGLAACAAALADPPFPLYRASRLLAFGFGAWVCTIVAAPWLGPVHAPFALLAAWPAWFLHRRLFFTVSDAAAAAGGGAVVGWTALLLAWSILDEDLSWMADWWHYFRSAPWSWAWAVGFAGAVVWRWRDYRRVPLALRAWEACRDRAVATLEEADPLEGALALSETLDDLADAFRLTADPGVRALAGHAVELRQASKALSHLGVTPDLEAELGGGYQTARDDCRTLAAGLRELRPAGPALRVSPSLRYRAGA